MIKKSVLSISLPESKSVPETDFNKFTFLISGERKIGKTDLFAQFPDSFFIMCEPGAKIQSIRKVDVTTWEEVKKIVFLLCEKPEYCKTVILDTGYMMYELCYSYCLSEMSLTDPSDEAWGSAWKMIEREFRSVHTQLINAGFGLGITAHSEIREIKRKGSSIVDHKLCVQLGGQAGKLYNSLVDVIAHYQYNEDGQRELILRDTGETEAGCRLKDHFRYTDGSPIYKLPMEFSHERDPAKFAYRQLLAAFNNQIDKQTGGINKITPRQKYANKLIKVKRS